VNRMPLMFDFARRATMVALEETAEKLGDAGARVTAIRELVHQVLAEAEVMRVVAAKDLGSGRLFDPNVIENKDIAPFQWRECAQSMHGLFFRPFAGWFEDAGKAFELAANEFEKSDGS